jgi:hypothetical protein
MAKESNKQTAKTGTASTSASKSGSGQAQAADVGTGTTAARRSAYEALFSGAPRGGIPMVLEYPIGFDINQLIEDWSVESTQEGAVICSLLLVLSKILDNGQVVQVSHGGIWTIDLVGCYQVSPLSNPNLVNYFASQGGNKVHNRIVPIIKAASGAMDSIMADDELRKMMDDSSFAGYLSVTFLGYSFLCAAVSEFENLQGVRHYASTPYHPQTTGMVERMHAMQDCLVIHHLHEISWFHWMDLEKQELNQDITCVNWNL